MAESASRPGQLLSISLATILEAGLCLRNSCVAKRKKLGRRTRLAALPLRTRPDFETSRALCGLAQNSAHSELTPNFVAQAAGIIETCSPPQCISISRDGEHSFLNRVVCVPFI
ncbi:hypothetical protein [Lapidilactobacillus salsurivasis]